MPSEGGRLNKCGLTVCVQRSQVRFFPWIAASLLSYSLRTQ